MHWKVRRQRIDIVCQATWFIVQHFTVIVVVVLIVVVFVIFYCYRMIAYCVVVYYVVVDSYYQDSGNPVYKMVNLTQTGKLIKMYTDKGPDSIRRYCSTELFKSQLYNSGREPYRIQLYDYDAWCDGIKRPQNVCRTSFTVEFLLLLHVHVHVYCSGRALMNLSNGYITSST